MIQAGLAGQGVALGRLELTLLEEHRLVQVAAPRHRTETMHAYWLIEAAMPPRDDVRRVAEWIVSEAQASQS